MYNDEQTTGLLDAEQHYRNAQPKADINHVGSKSPLLAKSGHL